MKATQLGALVAISLLAMSHSCRESATDAPCPESEIGGTSPQFYPCIPDQRNPEPQLFVINSQAEFGKAFACSSYSPRQSALRDSTLLVGWKYYASCGHVKSQRLTYACASNTYTYRVEIEAGMCAAAFPVKSQLLVPKLPAGAKVVLEMQ